MRLWTLHPRYLDARGLVALWREALLAQAVLAGRTRGYTRHPQLDRFREAPSPLNAIAVYLRVVHDEATKRSYDFDRTKIDKAGKAGLIDATEGQLDYEWAHLEAKLRSRAPVWLAGLDAEGPREAHPLFRIVPGPVEPWEKRSSREAYQGLGE